MILYVADIQSISQLAFLRRGKFGDKISAFLEDSHDYIAEMKKRKGELFMMSIVSLSIWLLHLYQFYLVFLCIHADVSLAFVLSLVPLAILVGLLPITVGGIGSRDAAMIALFSPYTEVTKVVFVGLFGSVRYFVPGLCGVPFFHEYMMHDEK